MQRNCNRWHSSLFTKKALNISFKKIMRLNNKLHIYNVTFLYLFLLEFLSRYLIHLFLQIYLN